MKDSILFQTAEVPLDCDELGHTMVSPETSVPLHRGDEIAHAILRLSREVFAPGPRSRRIANPANVFSRVSYRSQMAEVFRGNIPLTAVAPAVYLDYEPGIRWMVCIDDMYERNGGDVPRQWPGRMTRTRSKSEYVRGMSLSKAQREIIISTKLGVPI
jgi:hypothetical protein